MILSSKFKQGFKYINKNIWIILIPIIINVTELLAFQKIYNTQYIPRINFFTMKIGWISAPPRVKYLLEDFPSLIFQYNSNGGFRGIIYKLTPFNVFLLLSIMLIGSFIQSRYLKILSREDNKKVHIKDFFKIDNKLWFKFFLLQFIFYSPLVLMLIEREFLMLSFINAIFVYVQFSCVLDDGNIFVNFKKGLSFLFDYFGTTIKAMFYFGGIFALLSIFIYIFGNLGLIGIIIDIIIISYFGVATNKAILEMYREGTKKLQEQMQS